MSLTTYTALEGQSIYDVCLQTYGTLDLLYKLIQDNDIDNVNRVELKGIVFTFDTSLIYDKGLYINNQSTSTIYATRELMTPSNTPVINGSFDESFDDSFEK